MNNILLLILILIVGMYVGMSGMQMYEKILQVEEDKLELLKEVMQ